MSAFVFLFGTTLFSNNFFFTEATEIPCKPTIELVLEAPPFYLGSVSECLAEVKNKDHCPFPFPLFPTCGQNEYSGCQLAIVGAGTGGLYTALRLVDSNKIDGEDVCIFEATERVGGRLYSLRGFGPNKKITVDAGGYRTWPEYTVSLTSYTFFSSTVFTVKLQIRSFLLTYSPVLVCINSPLLMH